MVIHSWHDILWDRLWKKALHDKLGQKYDLIHFELDAMRSDSEQLLVNVNKAWHLYKSIKPDLVVLGDDEALRLMGMRFADELPVVYLGINNDPRTLVKTILSSEYDRQ